MEILLRFEKFDFVSARVVLVRSDMSAALEAACLENSIADLKAEAAATYNLWLAAIELRDRSSARTFFLHGLLRPWIVEITRQHMDEGRLILAAPPGGVFRITMMGADGRTVPYFRLLASTGDNTTMELPMDANGSYLTYDNPSGCRLWIDSGFSVKIDHLETAPQESSSPVIALPLD